MPKTASRSNGIVKREHFAICKFSHVSHCNTILDPNGKRNRGKRGCCDTCYQVLWTKTAEKNVTLDDFVQMGWMERSKRDLSRRIDEALKRRAS